MPGRTIDRVPGLALVAVLTACRPTSEPAGAAPSADLLEVRALYLDLMKRSLTDLTYTTVPKAREARQVGRDFPRRGLTMIGMKRLDNLQYCIEDVLARGVPGDLIETGAWRGGATIFMRAVLKAHGVTDRLVWVADSFEGLPPPEIRTSPYDAPSYLHEEGMLAVPLDAVQDNFRRYNLLDDQVKFLKGWFKDTLPTAPIKQLAVLRVDADFYESTMDALVNLYAKVAPGGYVIIDDYGAMRVCKRAVDEFREKHAITEEMVEIDWTGVYWKKGR